MFPVVLSAPEVTTKQMIEVDRLMVEDYRISLVQMMENAGRSTAILSRELFLGGSASGKRIAVMAGSGGNGGGALTAARRLASWGAQVSVGLSKPADDMVGVPRQQLDILSLIARVEFFEPDDFPQECDLIIDGLIGYSLRGAPVGRAAKYINAANSLQKPNLALDVPSGFDATTGELSILAIRASATMTLALPKFGMSRKSNRSHIGRLFCADISIPPSLYANIGIAEGDARIFSDGDIVEIAPTI